MYRYLLSY